MDRLPYLRAARDSSVEELGALLVQISPRPPAIFGRPFVLAQGLIDVLIERPLVSAAAAVVRRRGGLGCAVAAGLDAVWQGQGRRVDVSGGGIGGTAWVWRIRARGARKAAPLRMRKRSISSRHGA